MENWKAGEVHGAIEVIQSLTAADETLAATVRQASLLVIGGLTPMGIFFASLFNRSIRNFADGPCFGL